MRKRVAAAIIVILGSATLASSGPASAAFSFCLEPRVPHFYGTKPSKPFCAADRSCSDWQVRSYNSDVESYFSDLETYSDDVNKFYKKTREYIQCLADID